MSLTEPAATAGSVPVPSSGPTHPKHHAAQTPSSGREPADGGRRWSAIGQRTDSAQRHGGHSTDPHEEAP